MVRAAEALSYEISSLLTGQQATSQRGLRTSPGREVVWAGTFGKDSDAHSATSGNGSVAQASESNRKKLKFECKTPYSRSARRGRWSWFRRFFDAEIHHRNNRGSSSLFCVDQPSEPDASATSIKCDGV